MTGGLLGINDTWISFNPHTHAGCDTPAHIFTQAFNRFNPHTHAGCDENRHFEMIRHCSFNPHTHAGCDCNVNFQVYVVQFQSTHPRRVWLLVRLNSNVIGRFQSTHPRRVWPGRRSALLDQSKVSIHTPTQGVTAGNLVFGAGNEFQSTHPRRVWPWLIYMHKVHLLFQSTHPRRVWLVILIIVTLVLVFQSTHPRRVWHDLWSITYIDSCFNPHTHAGCDLWF